MILKQSDDKETQIKELESLLSIAPSIIKPKIEKELSMLRAGIKGEQESIYQIDFNFKDNNNFVVLHDLRFEINGNVAQIDHLIINRILDIYCLETKHFHSGIKISDGGEFMQFIPSKKIYVGMPSPIAQNERHIKVLQDIFKLCIDMPTRLGWTITPNFHSRILVNNSALVYRSKKFDSSCVMKSDQFFTSFRKDMDGTSLTSLAKVVSTETIENIALQLKSLHMPIKFNYRAKFGLDKTEDIKLQEKVIKQPEVIEQSPQTEVIESTENVHSCKKCNSKNVKIQYGKFGYYYKCSDCDGNTNIKVECSVAGHSAKLRKDGNRFFKDCADCKSSNLYYEN